MHHQTYRLPLVGALDGEARPPAGQTLGDALRRMLLFSLQGPTAT
ncbi:MAG TPA: hypothetical protein VF637_13105 [Sphingomicrobium sp.]|jgi:hypothetical protein